MPRNVKTAAAVSKKRRLNGGCIESPVDGKSRKNVVVRVSPDSKISRKSLVGTKIARASERVQGMLF